MATISNPIYLEAYGSLTGHTTNSIYETMGIHGLLKELGPPPRVSLAKLSSTHYTTHSRPLRLAIDISIWLFQIQSGRGGSNPALRTFYYRLLRLLSLNIHPLFVFDGPNKPLFKRNKKVGGPGVRVASVPEFLAKQLLKQFAFPWHVAPGEAEAECALLQREGVVDAVLSEDVDTLMFGSGVTLRKWESEGSGNKSPTHVSVYRAEETKERSRGVDREGMILVALMSGGDYLPDGIPGCGPKVACDAARAGFGAELCFLHRKDTAGLKAWKGRLQHEIRTNESKFFSRKNGGFVIPADFPNQEVLGYYTHPCVSTPEKVARLRATLRWDQAIDFAALRTFAADAFDWRCVGGAKKFIRNLAPAMLVRELRLLGEKDGGGGLGEEEQEVVERGFVGAIHGKRNHASVDGELEYRVSFVPATLVPIDLSLEDEDDEFVPAGGTQAGGDSDAETADDFAMLPSSTADEEEESEAPASPAAKKRQMRPFDPQQPEKLWVLKTFLQIGCPLLVEEYEASFRDPKEFLKQRRKAKAAGAKAGGDAEGGNIHAVKPKKTAAEGGGGGRKKGKATATGKPGGMQQNALMAYARVTKGGVSGREPLKETASQGNSQPKDPNGGGGQGDEDDEDVVKAVGGFRMPGTQLSAGLFGKDATTGRSQPQSRPSSARHGRSGEEGDDGLDDVVEAVDLSATPRAVQAQAQAQARPFAAFVPSRPASSAPASTATAPKRKPGPKPKPKQAPPPDVHQRTPTRRKRPSPSLSSPAMSQRTITSFYSPSPRKPISRPPARSAEFVNLVSSSPAKPTPAQPAARRALTPTPPNLRHQFVRSPSPCRKTAGSAVDNAPIVGGRCGGLDGMVDDGAGILDFSPGKLPETVTKRRRKAPREALRRYRTAPVLGADDDDGDVGFGDGYGDGGVVGGGGFLRSSLSPLLTPTLRAPELDGGFGAGGEVGVVEAMDLASPSPARWRYGGGGGGGFLLDGDGLGNEGEDELPSPAIHVGGLMVTGERSYTFSRDDLVPLVLPGGVQAGLSSSSLKPSAAHDVQREQDERSMLPPPPPPPLTAIKSHRAKPAANQRAPPRPSSTNTAQPLRRSPRQALAPAPALRSQPTHLKTRKKQTKTLILPRQSLEGTWKEIAVDAEAVDLSGDGSGWKRSGGRAAIVGLGVEGRGAGVRGYRKSGVEVLDMTGA